jgi:hypothetical protein
MKEYRQKLFSVLIRNICKSYNQEITGLQAKEKEVQTVLLKWKDWLT